MANPGLLTALGTLGAGLSTYGQVKREKDALARALEERNYARSLAEQQRAMEAQDRQRLIEQQNLQNERQRVGDIVNAVLGGFRPSGVSGLEIGGQQFGLPEIVTAEEKIAQNKMRFKAAYPQLTDAQADLLARGLMRPGEVLVDPGTQYNRPVGGTTRGSTGTAGTPPANSPRTLFSTQFGRGLVP